MKTGVLFYNHGERCLIRLCVAIHTLRRHYNGRVVIAAEGTMPEWTRQILSELKAEIMPLPQNHDYGLAKKAGLWKVTPFDETMYIDSDTVICASIQPFLQAIRNNGCVMPKFCGWGTERGRMRRRIEQWRAVAPDLVPAAIKFGWATNTGVQGWVRGAPLLPHYERLTKQAIGKGVAKKTLDEIAMQLLLPVYKPHVIGEEWNCSCTYGNLAAAKIVHYHGHKHCRDNAAGKLWQQEFWKLVESFPSEKAVLTGQGADASINLMLRDSIPGRLRNMTIVSAVNPAYAERMKANLELWLKTPGLKEQRFLVFVNGFARARDRVWLDRPNVEVVRWNYPFPEANARETMIAAFVIGAAEHVKTDYWMKLDGDTHPVTERWEWPDYTKQTIVSHKWGYTKMKGEKDIKRHWFNRLDSVFSPQAPMFKSELDPVADFRVSHRPGNKLGIPMRYGSFAHIERTAFTKRIAKVVNEKCGGRLPVPSHDTLTWYCATLWKEPVKLMNMKSWFSPR